jgi:KRAB domain-containing zinc finger protein
LTIHTLRLHTIKEKEFVCDICGFETKMKTDLNRHKQRKHHKKTLKCKFCDYCCRSKERLERHIDSKHQDVGGALSYICSECGKGFIYKNSLTKHLRMDHEKNTPFNCEHCTKSFVTESVLKWHKKSVHERVKCDMCNEEICNSFKLNRHKAKAHGIKPF